jgi:hypothetical protein
LFVFIDYFGEFMNQVNHGYGGTPPLPQSNAGLSGSVSNKKRWDDDIRWFDFPDRMMVTLRFFGPVYVTYNHWLKTRQGKRFPLCCSAYDNTTQSFSAGKCPICDDFNIPAIIDSAKAINPNFNEEFDPNLKEIKGTKARINALSQVLIRNVSNLGDPTLSTRPWHPVRLGPAVFFTLLKLKQFNVCTIEGKQYQADIADPYWGRDIHVMYNSNERNPQQKYMINLGEHTPLTEQEKAYLREAYNWGHLVEYSSFEETKQSLQINGYYQLLNSLTNTAPMFAQENNPGYAQYETYLKPPAPPAGYDQFNQNAQPPMPNMQQNPYGQPQAQAQQQNPYGQGMPQQQNPYGQVQQQPQQQNPYGQPQMHQQQNPYGQPQQQSPSQGYVPPPLVTPPSLDGLTYVDTPKATPVPTNVPPPLGYSNAPATKGGNLDEIPFDGPERTYPLNGRQVSKEEFNTFVGSFVSSLSRGQPVQVATVGDLAGANVPACYGDYQGDASCLKCSIRMHCVHV